MPLICYLRMSKKPETKYLSLPSETIIEVVRIKDDEVVKKEMSYGDWMKMKKQAGYVYIAYQKGFSKF